MKKLGRWSNPGRLSVVGKGIERIVFRGYLTRAAACGTAAASAIKPAVRILAVMEVSD